MGGDHKCPVCQATFTRPQHVARHMRSHTGDRPYKCQYCGDQFARSDLLSRHVNKCHANEKPLPNPSGARRKGASSATRATTSKQACDQCVQSSLPCDGSNPCAKCVSRKCRCTYVKFHRQTAPVGPGHNARSSGQSVPAPAGSMPSSSAFASGPGSSSRMPLYQHSEDDFILGPAPSVPTMAETLYNSNSFTFPPLYPQGSDLNPMHDVPPNYPTKYRAQQADLFGTGRSGLVTPLYDPRQGTWLAGWETQEPHDAYAQQQQPHQIPRQHEFLPGHGTASFIHGKHLPAELVHPNPTNSYLGNPNPGDNPPLSISMPYPGFVLPRGSSRLHQGGQGRNSSSSYSSNSNSRRGSVDFSESEDSGGPASGSVPCSAASSNVHLPLDGYGNTEYSIVDSVPDRRATSSTSSSSSHHREYERYGPQDERQEFSSAFGLMSLDDPAVIAGIAADGQPFFDDPSQAHNHQQSSNPEQNHDGLLTVDVGPDMDTPMPLKRDAGHINLLSMHQRPATASGVPASFSGPGVSGPGTTFGIGNLPTPSKDADSRELKEVWKQYIRTPLTGPQEAGPASNNAGPGGSNSKTGSPTSHRRQRVCSFPSTKTPMVETKDMFLSPVGLSYQQPGQRGRENPATMQGATSSLRTTLHGKEDLRSYEAAVMARKAPTLNLQLKRPMKGKSATTGSSQQQQNNTVISGPPSANDSQNASPQLGFESASLNSSARQSSSSLANAFGERAETTVSGSSSRSMSGQEETSSPSLPSSRDTSVDAHSTSASSEGELRPSFKRLASQTIGPDNSKRAYFGYDGDVGDRDRPAGWSTGAPNMKPMQLSGFAGVGGRPPVMHQPSIADRKRRRMSVPSSRVDEVGLGPEHEGTFLHIKPPVDGGVNGVGEVQPFGYAPASQGG